MILYEGNNYILAILLIYLPIIGCSSEQNVAYHSKGVELKNSKYLVENLKQNVMPIESHRLKLGKGIVLTYRKISTKNVRIFDSEVVEHLTLWFPDKLVNKGIVNFGENNDVIGTYHIVSTQWPKSGCYGYVNKGSIKLNNLRSNAESLIDVEIDYLGRSKCDEVLPNKMNFKVNFKFLENKKLIFWQNSLQY